MRRILAGLAAVLLLACVPSAASAADETEAGGLQLHESETAIVVTRDGATVVAYNKQSPRLPDGVSPDYQRSGFLHPVGSPAGQVVTALFPADHLHQDGVFSAWVKTTWNGRSIDFWNLAGGTGRVLHQRVESTWCEDSQAGFEVSLLHRVVQSPVADVLSERWKVTVDVGDASCHRFDLETTQSALTDVPLIVKRHHYGGVALRGPTEWLLPRQPAGESASAADGTQQPRFVNSQGADRIQGNLQKAKWVALSGVLDDQPVTVSVLCHANNYRAPQAARLHPSKPYFCFAPCAEGEFVIDRQHPYQAKYRFLITDARPDADWLNQQWQDWCGRSSAGPGPESEQN